MHSNQVVDAARQSIHWILIPAVAISLVLWPTLSSGLTQLQPDPGDSLLNNYFLEHAYQHIRNGELLNPENFWSPDFFWPIKDTLAWSDHLIGPSILYGMVRTIVHNPYTAYVGWLILTLSLNYISFRRSLSIISPKATASWISLITTITVFSPTITTQIGHPQLLSLFLIGPILVYCNKLLAPNKGSDFTLSDWLMLGFLLLGNGIFNIYIFVYACYGALVCTSIHIIRRYQKQCFSFKVGEKIIRSVVLFFSIFCANLIIYLPYLRSLSTFGKRPMSEIVENLPKPASWLFSNHHLLLPPLFNQERISTDWIYGSEQELFPGWLLVILFIGSIITALHRKTSQQQHLRMWLIAIAIMFLGCLSVMDLSLWPLVSKLIPGASSLRASSRIGIIIVLFSSPCLTTASCNWASIKTFISGFLATLIGFIAAVASIWSIGQPSFSMSAWKSQFLKFREVVVSNQCDVFWREWKDEPPWKAHVQAMHIQQSSGIPTLNGYSGHFPKPDWPFTNSSGEVIYEWVLANTNSKYHNFRSTPIASLRFCIVSWDPTTKKALIHIVHPNSDSKIYPK